MKARDNERIHPLDVYRMKDRLRGGPILPEQWTAPRRRIPLRILVGRIVGSGILVYLIYRWVQ